MKNFLYIAILIFILNLTCIFKIDALTAYISNIRNSSNIQITITNSLNKKESVIMAPNTRYSVNFEIDTNIYNFIQNNLKKQFQYALRTVSGIEKTFSIPQISQLKGNNSCLLVETKKFDISSNIRLINNEYESYLFESSNISKITLPCLIKFDHNCLDFVYFLVWELPSNPKDAIDYFWSVHKCQSNSPDSRYEFNLEIKEDLQIKVVDILKNGKSVVKGFKEIDQIDLFE